MIDDIVVWTRSRQQTNIDNGPLGSAYDSLYLKSIALWSILLIQIEKTRVNWVPALYLKAGGITGAKVETDPVACMAENENSSETDPIPNEFGAYEECG